MIPIPPYALKLGAYGLILGATYISGCVRGSQTANARTEQVKADYLQFRVNTEAIGKAAQKEADATRAANEQKAKASDESYSKALTVLGADLERLRRARASTDGLSAPAPSPTCPEGQRCFDRGQFDAALREYEGEVLTLVGEGAALKLRLDFAVKWASDISSEQRVR